VRKAIFALPCPGGEIGRRTVFRWRRREVCWFESSPGHLMKKTL
jgi:hypothetical protein